MRRSLQEIIELVVFGLIALLIGTGVLWVAGWALDIVGLVLRFIAGLIWSLLRFIIPLGIVAAAVYALVRLLQNQNRPQAAAATSTVPAQPAPPPPPPAPPEEAAEAVEEEADEGAGEDVADEGGGEDEGESEKPS